MGLKLVVDSLDGIDEGLAKLYSKGDDEKFHLSVDDVPDVTNLKKALDSERKARGEADKKYATLAKQFEGLDAEEIRKLLANMEGDEEAKLIKDGKLDQVISKRTEKFMKEAEKNLKAANDKASAAEAKAARWVQRVLDNAIREAAVKAGLHAGGVDDALLAGRLIFSLDDNGNAVQLDEDGKIVLGKDSKTPFTVAEWLESMREVKPHWYPATASGGGARQSAVIAGNAKKTMRSSDFNALPPKERARLMKQEGFTLTDQ